MNWLDPALFLGVMFLAVALVAVGCRHAYREMDGQIMRAERASS